MALNVKYLGLELRNPVIVSSSPLTASVEKIIALEKHGAGAVVLKSIFEEQIMGEAAFLDRYNDYPEAADYLNAYLSSDYLAGHLALIAEAKQKVDIPVIASINCSTDGSWVDYAKSIERAGADALELNIFFLPTDARMTSAAIEERYLSVVNAVTSQLRIPVSVKLGMRFTNVLSICREIYYRGGKGVVMFNRFFEPNIDVNTMSMSTAESLSTNSELRNSLRWVGLCSSEIPMLDVAVTGGVHTGEDAVKALLAGARAVEICSTIYINGLDVIGQIAGYIEDWMSTHSFDAVADFTGKLNYNGSGDKQLFQRAQYMKYFPKQ